MTMRITVFGAAGNVGRRVTAEALRRGHEVAAVIRNPDRASALPAEARRRIGDASRAADVAELSAGQDLVVSATRPAAGREGELAAAARGLLAGLAGTGIRLLAVGGAGSLAVPGTGGTLAIDDPQYVPAPWRAIAAACTEQLAVFRSDTAVDWAYLSPPALLEPGERTGRYRVGTDELLVDSRGRSAISMEDLAVALLDEAEHPSRHRARFTVGY